MLSAAMGFRKSFKKNKMVRVAMAQYVRRMLLLLKIKRLHMFVNSTSAGLPFFFKFLITPTTKPFLNPLTNQMVDEESRPLKAPQVEYLVFRSPEA